MPKQGYRLAYSPPTHRLTRAESFACFVSRTLLASSRVRTMFLGAAAIKTAPHLRRVEECGRDEHKFNYLIGMDMDTRADGGQTAWG